MKMDRTGAALLYAMNNALSQPECEVRVSFETEEEWQEAVKRFNTLVNHELLPGIKSGSFIFDPENSTKNQLELKNGSCILLLLNN